MINHPLKYRITLNSFAPGIPSARPSIDSHHAPPSPPTLQLSSLVGSKVIYTFTSLLDLKKDSRSLEAPTDSIHHYCPLATTSRFLRDISDLESLLMLRRNFHRDKFHEPKVYERFTEIVPDDSASAKQARANESKAKPDVDPECENTQYPSCTSQGYVEDHRPQAKRSRRVEGKLFLLA